MIERVLERLKSLTRLNGVSGSERAVVMALAAAFREVADRVEVDSFGNLCTVRGGAKGSRRLMLMAHSDEVGCVVSAVLPDGKLQVEPMGRISLRAMPGARVRVGTAGLAGVVATPSAHVDADDHGLIPFPLLRVDIGADSEAEARALGVAEGDAVAFDAPLERLAGARVTGKALDNRIGCAVLLEVLRAFQGSEVPVTVLAAVSVQEEVGMRGARMLAERWQPDVAIAVDTVPADDLDPRAGCPGIRLGAGPVIQLVEGVANVYVGTIIHPAVRRLIERAAADEGIPLQTSVSGRWTTDAAVVHTAHVGIPTGFVSIPRRYAHSPAEVVDLNDVVRAIRLLVAVVRVATEAGLDFFSYGDGTG